MNIKTFIFFLIIFPNISFAQFSAGLKAGTSISNVLSDNSIIINGYRKNKKTVKFGAYLNYKLVDKKIGFQTELLFANYGYNQGESSNIGIINLHLQYTEIPLHICYYLRPEFFISTGAKISILGKADYYKQNNGDITEINFSPFDYGAFFNVNYSFAPSFKVNIRYDYCFTNIIQNVEGNLVNQNPVFANNHLFSLCFSIGFTQGEHRNEAFEDGEIE